MRCRFDFVKIDRLLVEEIGDRAEQRRPAWLDGLAALLGRTALQIVAEGVESQAQREILTEAGVQWGQGHLFAAPLPADGFMRFYEQTSGAGL
jgi:EAL domain-containing protein (putative c-di-GMP-specific phosphodiesterase class I)